MRLPEISQKPFRFWMVWGVAGWFEITAFFAFFSNAMFDRAVAWRLFLIDHLLAVIILLFVVPPSRFGLLDGKRLWGRIAAPLTLLLPFWGWFLTGILYLSRSCFFTEETQIDQMDPQEELTLSREIIETEFLETPYHSIDVQDRIDLIPLVDLLKSRDDELRRGAVEKLAMLGTPEAIASLLEQRRHESADVRFYVTSALTKLKKDFDESIDHARRMYRQNPDEDENRLKLAQSYMRYVRSGLLDPANRDQYAEESRFHLQTLAKSSDPHFSNAILMQLLEFEAGIDKWENARRISETIDANYLKAPEKFIQMRILIHYQLRLFKVMFREIELLKRFASVDPAWNSILNLWGAH